MDQHPNLNREPDGQPPVGGPPPFGGPPPNQEGKGAAIASLVLGIIALVSFWYPIVNIASLILSIVGLVLAISARKKGFVGGMATAGLVLSIIALVLSGIGFFTCTVCLLCVAATTPLW